MFLFILFTSLMFSDQKSAVQEKDLLEVVDSNRDGVVELKKYFKLDEKGNKNLVKKEVDINLDGKVDYVYHYNNVNTDKIQMIEVDHDFDGAFDEVRFYSPIDGTLSKKEFDTNFDGKADIVKRYYNGKLVRKEVDRNFDTKPDYWEYYQDNRLSRTEVDSNFDGRTDKIGRTEIFKVQNFDVRKIESELGKTKSVDKKPSMEEIKQDVKKMESKNMKKASKPKKTSTKKSVKKKK